jgi:cobalamin biosynthesis Mg chelatase CobN
MRKTVMLVAIALLCATFAFAQADSGSQPVQQPSSAQSGQSASPSTQPPAQSSADQGAARSGSKAADANPPAADQGAAQADRDRKASAANPPANQDGQRAASPTGGVPWGWIVLGIVVVAVILALIGRGTDNTTERTERVESINRSDRDVVIRDRRDDDIRRVG